MKSTAEATGELRRRVERRLRDWALGGEFTALRTSSAAPTEDTAWADIPAFERWLADWRLFAASHQGIDGLTVDWATRRWAGATRQQLPVRLRLDTRTAALRLTGLTERFSLMRARARLLAGIGGGLVESTPAPEVAAALRPLLGRLAELPAVEVDRLAAVLTWFVEHPEEDVEAADGHLRPPSVRELPIERVDTKWIETHRGLIAPLLPVLAAGRARRLRHKQPLVRVRILDPTALTGPWPAGIDDVSLPVDQAARLAVAPGTTVLVVENEESFLSLPAVGSAGNGADVPMGLAIFGDGRAAAVLSGLDWLDDCRILYWGDVDTHGFAILDMVRARFPRTRSVLMNATVRDRFAHLAGREPTLFTRTADELTHLTPAERACCASLAGLGDYRLEQERIPWSYVLATLGRVEA
ncbi:DUF2220 family protein [Brevibacterium sp. 50QC2O2]|uniref:Wadjet anti-phage system protein JetD domain-containing protein n=1 Tax=Brevibacterium TaxID=1696 RepID=UPI00211C458E|nr:DUF2220 family protein [Brevibacterium sp. 68QC2CO]MCQ9388801.1 DUF2220 family protein [Brevibacterium sp. 50QC2O2]